MDLSNGAAVAATMGGEAVVYMVEGELVAGNVLAAAALFSSP